MWCLKCTRKCHTTLLFLIYFQRVHNRDNMIQGAPTGTVGTTYHTGWMTAGIWMDHFIKHSHCSKEEPVLLIMDNHDTHMSVNILDKAKDHGISPVTFPPHCSHKLQPLDNTVYGPLKRYFNEASNPWMTRNPGKTITIYDISQLLGEAFP